MRILLTGVGCPGAHALISNLKLQDKKIFILGTNANEQAIGRWLCDDFAVVPWAYEENYIDSIIDLVKKNQNIPACILKYDLMVNRRIRKNICRR